MCAEKTESPRSPWRRLRILRILGLSALPVLSLTASPGDPVDRADEIRRTLVVYNRSLEASAQLARTYSAARGIPEANLVGLETSKHETISWQAYLDTIHNPLLERLIQADWLTGSLAAADAVHPNGKRQAVLFENRIAHLVLMKGLPMKVTHDAVRGTDPSSEKNVNARRMGSWRGSIDSDLALLTQPELDPAGASRNPLFNEAEPNGLMRQAIVRTARIDGPSFALCERLITRTLEAEKKGIRGRALIDAGGPHAQGDRWLDLTRDKLAGLGFPLTYDDSRKRFGWGDPLDQVAWYFGWYANAAEGPFADPVFSFAPGAIALHIHSFSASTIRLDTKAWVGPLLARGASVAIGNVWEPYLGMTHRPHLLVDGLARGWSLGRAAWYSIPVTSWQGVVIGDPLYRPLAVPLDEQLESTADKASRDPLAPYVTLRQMNRLARSENPEERKQARRLGERAFHTQPGIALGIAVAEHQLQAGDPEAARRQLAYLAHLPPPSVIDLAQINRGARLLKEAGQPDAALVVLLNTLDTRFPDRATAVAQFKRVIEAARQQGRQRLARSLENRLTEEWPAPED
ncbi:MAG: TIGR03790 family protein [Opitutales bacterium]